MPVDSTRCAEPTHKISVPEYVFENLNFIDGRLC